MCDSFTLYRSVFDALMACEPEICQDVLRMVGEYSMDGKAPEKPGMAFAMFLTIRPLIDARTKKAEAGRLGGLQRAENQKVLESASSKLKQAEAREQQIQAKEERRKKESIIKEKEKEKKEKESPPYETIIDYLNQKAGTAYRSTGAETRKHIHARWSENYTLEDFKTVIDKKVAEWGGTDMAQYLRPVTLFGTKFESYLNAKPGKPKTENKNRFNNFHQRDYDWDALERSLMK